MDYRKHYNRLMERGSTRNLADGIYFETHHIIPKSEGGTNNASNLVKLTAREHFVAHWLLHRESPNTYSRSFSFWRMCNGKGKVPTSKWIVVSSRAYEEGKLAFRTAIKGVLKGRPKSREHIQKVALANTGKKRSKESRDRMSVAAKSRPISEGFSKLRESRIIQDERQRKQVAMVLLDGSTVHKIFSSLKQAAEFVNRDSSNLSVAIKKGKTSAGYYWKYLPM